MSKYTWEEYKSRVQFSQQIFSMIEANLSDFLSYVPLTLEHLDVYSLRLITVILEIGPEILSSFDFEVFHKGASAIREAFDNSIKKRRERLLSKEKKLRNRYKSLSFRDYYDFLSSTGLREIRNEAVRIKDLDAYTIPFETVNPDWWDSYNLLKHDKYNNLKRATLRNALNACSALFLILDSNSDRIQQPLISSLFDRSELYEVRKLSLTKI